MEFGKLFEIWHDEMGPDDCTGKSMEELLALGIQHVNDKEYYDAIMYLEEALKEPGDAELYIRNNLALALCCVDDFVGAKHVLEENKDLLKAGNSYYYGLLSMIKLEGGDENAARRYFNKGVKVFQDLQDMQPDAYPADVWEAHGLMLMKAGTAAGRFKDALRFYRKNLEACKIRDVHDLAGRCAFNEQKFKQAGMYWKKIRPDQDDQKSVDTGLEGFIAGKLPGFSMLYGLELAFDFMTDLDVLKFALEKNEALFGYPLWVMLLEYSKRKNPFEERMSILSCIARQAVDEWGVDFCKYILQAPELEMAEKQGALQVLCELEIYQLGEKVEANLGGETIEISYRPFVVHADDLASHMIAVEVQGILAAGDKDLAIQMLKERIHEDGIAAPELMMIFADLMVETGENDLAKEHLEAIRGFDKSYSGLEERLLKVKPA